MTLPGMSGGPGSVPHPSRPDGICPARGVASIRHRAGLSCATFAAPPHPSPTLRRGKSPNPAPSVCPCPTELVLTRHQLGSGPPVTPVPTRSFPDLSTRIGHGKSGRPSFPAETGRAPTQRQRGSRPDWSEPPVHGCRARPVSGPGVRARRGQGRTASPLAPRNTRPDPAAERNPVGARPGSLSFPDFPTSRPSRRASGTGPACAARP